jgi:flagellar basal-body rod modification protein FlgD
MQLMLAQLQNQDPLNPMKDEDFIAQLAQFNSLNELTKMNQTLTELMNTQALSQGSALIGKTVIGFSSEGETVTGVVSGLYIRDDRVTLDVEGQQLPLEAVQSVQETEEDSDDGGQT